MNPRKLASPGIKVYRRNKTNKVSKDIHKALSQATSKRNLISTNIIRKPIIGIKSVK